MKFSNFINESSEKINKSIAKGIYDEVFTKAIECRDPDSFQCHCSVMWVKNNLKDNWWYKELEFILWDERKWDKISQRLLKDNAVKKFKSKPIKELIEDISDFTVNGHSLIKFRNYYIDPYMKSKKVSEKIIQKFGQYWEKIQ